MFLLIFHMFLLIFTLFLWIFPMFLLIFPMFLLLVPMFLWIFQRFSSCFQCFYGLFLWPRPMDQGGIDTHRHQIATRYITLKTTLPGHPLPKGRARFSCQKRRSAPQTPYSPFGRTKQLTSQPAGLPFVMYAPRGMQQCAYQIKTTKQTWYSSAMVRIIEYRKLAARKCNKHAHKLHLSPKAIEQWLNLKANANPNQIHNIASCWIIPEPWRIQCQS